MLGVALGRIKKLKVFFGGFIQYRRFCEVEVAQRSGGSMQMIEENDQLNKNQIEKKFESFK